MKIGVTQEAALTVLTLDGVLNVEASPSVYLSFQRELLRGRTRFLFDMAAVPFVDSSGLGVLVRCYKDARSRGGEVGLKQVPPDIERILEFTRLDAIFPLNPSRVVRPDFPEVDAA